MKIKLIALLLITSAIVISCNRKTNKTDDPIVSAPANDQELEMAKNKAQSNLAVFVNSFQEHTNDTTYQYSVKADFTQNGEHEHMWISLNKIDKDQFIGTLGNDPQFITNMKFGDPITLTKKQIEDWTIMNSNTNQMEGGYSVKVLQSRQ